jgi:hypothetical protein
MSLYRSDENPEEGVRANTKSFAIGMGNLFAFAIFSSKANVEFNFNEKQCLKLWPSNSGKVAWPLRFPISSQQAEFIAVSLER